MKTTLNSIRRRTESLNQSNFAAFLNSRRIVIVHIGPGSNRDSFLSGILEHFTADLGDQVAFGCLDTSKLLYAPWPLKFVGDIFSEALTMAPSGYYLFERGRVHSFHPGQAPTDDAQFKENLFVFGVSSIFSLLSDSAKPLDDLTGAMNLRHAKAVISHFEQSLAPTSEKPKGDWNSPSSKVSSKENSPYERLGITPDATDEEVKQAFRTQTSLNHPDKVAHLAPALQNFAAEQFKIIKAAYDQIMARRRG